MLAGCGMYRIVIIFVLTTTQSRTCLKELIVKILILILPAGLFSQEPSGESSYETPGQPSTILNSLHSQEQPGSNPQEKAGLNTREPSVQSSQNLSGIRERVVIADRDTIKLDSLMIVPGTLVIHTFPEREYVANDLYLADPSNSLLIINKKFPYYGKSLHIRYRVFTADPSLGLSRKDTTLIIPYQREPGSDDLHRYTYRPVSDEIWKEETLNRSGSISRGITFGNNQDVIVNSNLNLQLSGKLDDNLNIVASISDQNIPLQPEGYSQQIHEFDKIFIRLFNDYISLTAGDFEVRGGGGMFLPLDKKAQGIQFSTVIEPEDGRVTGLTNTSSAAIAKGRYHRNSLRGVEGNQGPYKLKGANNELFIIVLAGSERVFVDGRMMERGVDRHYIIDYNLAEITFTPNMPVTRDKRIVVEFEYSDRNYARFMIANTTGLSTERGDYFINIFSEHDARNQPLLQDLEEVEKRLLSAIGDNLNEAWIPKVDSVEFRNDMVLYEKTDTVVNGTSYTIYRHSVDPERAHYRPGFSYVGENRGNYKPETTSANGRVYGWTAPVNGVPAGSHEPVTLLVTPKKQQVVSLGGSSSLSDNSAASFEVAISNNDLNTFSSLDNEDNVGLAFKAGLDKTIPLTGEGHFLAGGAEYEFSDRKFASAERYRPVEHERDWNIGNGDGRNDEQRIGWHAGYNRHADNFIRYRGEYLTLGDNYAGLRNMVEGAAGLAGFEGKLMVSYLDSGSETTGTGFFRHFAEVSRSIRFLRLGIRSEGEENRIVEKSGGLMSATSFAFHQREVFLENADTAKLHFFSAYRERDDKLPVEGNLENTSFAREFSAGFRSEIGPGNRLSGTVHHRRFKPVGEAGGLSVTPENSLNGRLEARLRFLGGSVESTGFYETGSGLESKKEFMYIEVSRGQGTHTWTDYNENGIKELDEFEPARFSDQANYIRIMIPTDDYIRTRTNQLSQTVRIAPPVSWQDSEGLRKLFSRFSGQTAFQTSQKSTQSDLFTIINPFGTGIADTSLISATSSLRNSISFRPAGRRLAIDYLNQHSGSKSLLANGSDTRQMRSDAIDTRFEVTTAIVLTNRFEAATKSYRSEFFPGRNFNIGMLSGRMGVSFQPGFVLQTAVHLEWTQQLNHSGKERSEQVNLGSELSYTIRSQGNILFRIDYYHIEYNEGANTPVAWEMLGGLRPGDNMTVMLQLQQNLAGNLQMSINYNGRGAAGGRFIHTGGMQVRAYF